MDLSITYIPSELPPHRQAMNGQEREDWLEAENRKFQSHRDNNVFTECKLPQGRRTIRMKWVYKI